MYTNMSTNGIVKVPGNDGMGGGCLNSNALPGFDFAKDRDIFVANTNNGTYNATAWSQCCRYRTVSLENSCYPYCDIPLDLLGKGKGNSHVADDMSNCIGLTDVLASVILSGGHAPAPPLPALLTAGMVFIYMFI